MKMLRWSCGLTMKDKIRNEYIRGSMKVGKASEKIHEARLRWYGHVMRREDEYVGKKLMKMKPQGRRKRGRPKRRWIDGVKNGMEARGLTDEMTQRRALWRTQIRSSDPM